MCGIYYTYDANGERILRKDDCVDTRESGPMTSQFGGVLYPNPTSGRFTVGFNELVQSARLTVTAIDGLQIGYAEAEQAYEMDFDITRVAPGSYVVTVFVTPPGRVRRSAGLFANQK